MCGLDFRIIVIGVLVLGSYIIVLVNVVPIIKVRFGGVPGGGRL